MWRAWLFIKLPKQREQLFHERRAVDFPAAWIGEFDHLAWPPGSGNGAVDMGPDRSEHRHDGRGGQLGNGGVEEGRCGPACGGSFRVAQKVDGQRGAVGQVTAFTVKIGQKAGAGKLRV